MEHQRRRQSLVLRFRQCRQPELPGGRRGSAGVRVFPNGDFLIAGQLTALGNGGGVFPDYVFDDDYELMPLVDLRAFVEEKNHLPNVVSGAEVAAAGGINMTQLQLQLLEKVEELTLYVLQQQEELQAQQEHIERLEARLTSTEIAGGVISPFLW